MYGAYPWVPVLTTLVGALTTYAGLSNAEFLANSYAHTARQLKELEEDWRDYGAGRFAELVRQAEWVIASEYTGWMRMQPSLEAESLRKGRP